MERGRSATKIWTSTKTHSTSVVRNNIYEYDLKFADGKIIEHIQNTYTFATYRKETTTITKRRESPLGHNENRLNQRNRIFYERKCIQNEITHQQSLYNFGVYAVCQTNQWEVKTR